MWPFSSSRKEQPQSSFPEPSTDFPSSSSSATAGPSYQQQQQQQQQQDQSTTAYLSSATITQPAASSYDATYTPTASSLFSSPGFDPVRLHPMAGLGKEDVEYLDIVDQQPNQLEGARTALPSRGWSDDLCYGTGTTYLSGLTVGGLLGAREGLMRPLGVDNATFRLRLNALLNQVTRRGSFMGNSAAVIALIYNSLDAIIDNVRGKHDMAGAMAAAGLSGAIFKSTAGPRPMMISSGLMMAAAAAWTQAKQAML